MWSYSIQRILQTIPVIIGIILITFFLMRMIPGTAVDVRLGQRESAAARAAIERELGLDRPVWRQLAGYFILDFGKSSNSGEPARDLILNRFANTLKLTIGAMVFAVILGVGVGILAAVCRATWVDYVAMIFALLGISTPVFWFGILLILLAVEVGWKHIIDDGTGAVKFLILPAITLGTRSVAYIARMTRSAMLEVLQADYLRTARAKGLSNAKVIMKHALSNALIPVITIIGLDFASYLTGAVLTETIFNYPGIGRELVDSIKNRDTNVILCGVVVVTVTFVIVNLLVDLLYGLIDPRIRCKAQEA
jgi:ABC-type dipeptide/oligopeptide/nickel transport system permease component